MVICKKKLFLPYLQSTICASSLSISLSFFRAATSQRGYKEKNRVNNDGRIFLASPTLFHLPYITRKSRAKKFEEIFHVFFYNPSLPCIQNLDTYLATSFKTELKHLPSFVPLQPYGDSSISLSRVSLLCDSFFQVLNHLYFVGRVFLKGKIKEIKRNQHYYMKNSLSTLNIV